MDILGVLLAAGIVIVPAVRNVRRRLASLLLRAASGLLGLAAIANAMLAATAIRNHDADSPHWLYLGVAIGFTIVAAFFLTAAWRGPKAAG